MQVCILLVAGSEKEGKEALFRARVQVPKKVTNNTQSCTKDITL